EIVRIRSPGHIGISGSINHNAATAVTAEAVFTTAAQVGGKYQAGAGRIQLRHEGVGSRRGRSRRRVAAPRAGLDGTKGWKIGRIGHARYVGVGQAGGWVRV